MRDILSDSIEIEHQLLAWVNAQPNSAEIKEWILTEHQRRIEWQDETYIVNPRALNIDNDVMDCLFYMAGLATPDKPPRWDVFYSNAYFSLIVGLKRKIRPRTSRTQY